MDKISLLDKEGISAGNSMVASSISEQEKSFAPGKFHFAPMNPEIVYLHPNSCIENGMPSQQVDYSFHRYRQNWMALNQEYCFRKVASHPYPTQMCSFDMMLAASDRRYPLTHISHHLPDQRSQTLSKESIKRNREERGSNVSSNSSLNIDQQKENKRPKSLYDEKKVHDFDREDFSKLNILCQAIDFQQRKDKVHSCSCPRSQCIKLYCECFQSGRKCSESCSCKKCKNTDAESGPSGARTKAINKILSRNPQAFNRDKPQLDRSRSIGITCRCVKSHCLKLYCECFHSGNTCGPHCLCVNCLNTKEESGTKGKRTIATKRCLERKPDAFKKKKKEGGSGCSCKSSR